MLLNLLELLVLFVHVLDLFLQRLNNDLTFKVFHVALLLLLSSSYGNIVFVARLFWHGATLHLLVLLLLILVHDGVGDLQTGRT